nr:reverse transcriptase domain-containing protein [Tanacetum cinerariifolium]
MRVGLRTIRDPQAPKPIVEERVKVAINPEYPEQTIMIGSTLTKEGRNKLCNLLQRNLDIFAWKPADMTSVLRHIVEYHLNVREGCSPIRQTKIGQAADKNQAIHDEVGKLVEAEIMKEVHYHDWLSNLVMVKKHDDSWRTCVDFKDLNKACPKDGYPLLEINWKVESLCGFPFKCFLNAYKGYHQIQMKKEDEEKIAFITSQRIFCYTKIPFGLRNAGATYQRLVDKAFHKQIGRNLEVYVDDLVIKSLTEDEIVRDIEETFKTLREINMKLNSKKCTFDVEKGMFLEYKVNAKGLKVCPDKVDAILSPLTPKCLKDVKKLNGKLASLNRFLAKLAEKSLPFFKTLKKCTNKSDFHWTTEAEEAFKQIKQLIAELPMLTAPMEKKELIVYLAAAKETEESLDTLMEVEEEIPEPWILFMDGSSCTDGSRVGLTLTNPTGMEFTYALRFRFDATNNEAEYEVLIAGLRIAKQTGVKNLQENTNSHLVANQVNGTYVAKEADMIRYMEKVRALTSSFKAFSIRQVPRSENKKAYTLSKIASISFAHLSKQVLVEELKEKSISKVEILAVVEEEGDTRMTPIFEYLKDETLSADVKKARADCQVHKPILRNPHQTLTPITSPWPFYKWGIDIARPFPEGSGKIKFLIVAVYYFTKWIKAKPVATITGNQIKNSCGITFSVDLGSQERSFQIMENSLGTIHLKIGTEAVIPAEISMPTLRTAEVDLVQNNEALGINLDLLEERREEATIREAKRKARMEKYYNSKVKNKSFKPGDLVYRNNDASHTKDTWKLGPKWEGPYEVTEALGKGAYKLRDRDGK